MSMYYQAAHGDKPLRSSMSPHSWSKKEFPALYTSSNLVEDNSFSTHEAHMLVAFKSRYIAFIDFLQFIDETEKYKM